MNLKIMIQKLKKFWESKSDKAKKSIVISSVIFLSLAILLIYLYNRTTYEFLLTSEDTTVSANVITQLKTKGIKYKVQGKSIYVADNNVDALKLELSGDGALDGAKNSSAASSSVNLFSQSSFLSDSQQTQLVKKDLESNLASVIKSYGEIQDAEVLLTLGNQSSFDSENTPSKAAIKLKLNSKLSSKQISSIQKLAAAAVPNLDANSVVITDNNNNLLSNSNGESGSDDNDEYVKAKEDNISSQINDMLSLAFPNSSFKVVTRIQMNFDQSKIEKETVQSGPDTVVSKQTSTEKTYSSSTSGQTGVASNVPSYQTTTNNTSNPVTEKESQTINYDLNKIKENITKSPEISQMSVSVIANRTLTPTEQSQITKLVSTAALLNPSRGDMVSVQGFNSGSKSSENNSNTNNNSKYISLLINKSPLILISILLFILFLRLISLLKDDSKKKIKPSKNKSVEKMPSNNITINPINNQKVDDISTQENNSSSEPLDINKITNDNIIEDLNSDEKAEKTKQLKQIIQKEISENPQKVASVLRTWKNSSR